MSDRREHAEPEFPDFEDEAIDLALVHADDEYLDMLAGFDLDSREEPLDGFGDDQLTELLMTWRREVDAEPIGELVDTKLATVTVHAARMQRKRRPRLLVPIAAAAAVLAIAFAGVGLAARDAQPGDTLWALTKVLYADHARSVEAAQAVKDDLREAKAALTQGDIDVAKSKLADAHAALPTVLPDDGRNELKAEHESLMAKLPGSPSDSVGPAPTPDPTTQPGVGASGSGSATNPPPSSNPATETPPPSSSPNTTDSSSPPPSSESTPRTESTSGETAGGPASAPAGAPAVEAP